MCFLAIQASPDISKGGYQTFLLGDTFIRNYYSVFDFDHQKVGFAVNSQAKNFASLHTLSNPLIPFASLMGVTWSICLGAYIFFAIVDNRRIAYSVNKHLK